MPPSRLAGATSGASVSKAVVTRRVLPREFVGGQLVVVGGPRSLQVDVLPEVGDRPADVAAERERSDTCCLQRGRVSDELLAMSWECS